MIDTALQETWRQRLEGFDGSGMSARDWCEANGITIDRFYFWRRRLRAAAPQSARQQTAGAVLQVAEPMPATPCAIAVRVGCATIDVTPGFDHDHLRAVVRALSNSAC